MIYLFLANGTEEIEALATVDIIRRAGLPIQTVSTTGIALVTGAHGIQIVADTIIEDIDLATATMLILPGGMPGATNFASHERLNQYLLQHAADGKPIAAICASPLVLGRLGLLQGHRATCYPGFESELKGATCTQQPVETDGQFITGNGPAAAFDFALTIVRTLTNEATATNVAKGMLYA